MSAQLCVPEGSLREIILKHCPRLGDEPFLAFMRHCGTIEALDTCAAAVAIYHIGHEILNSYLDEKDLILRRLAFLQRQVGGCEIYFSAEIGKDFLLVHGLGTVIGSRVVCGDGVTVYHGVTIGTLYDTSKEKPIIGDGSILYAGAKVLGGIQIGQHAVIGANCLVTQNVPDLAIVVGSPMRIVGYRSDPHNDKYKLPVGTV